MSEPTNIIMNVFVITVKVGLFCVPFLFILDLSGGIVPSFNVREILVFRSVGGLWRS